MMFDQYIRETIREHRSGNAQNKQLDAATLELIYSRNWFNIWVPHRYGGLEMDLPAGCRLLEDIAYQDGALGWTVTLCAGANMFVGYLDPAVAQAVFADPKVCFGGSGRVCGQARAVAGGYRLSGMWPYVTGAPHLTHFTCLAPIQAGHAAPAVVKAFFIPREQVLIHYDWQTFGLEATASHSFSVSDILVPDTHTFLLDPHAAVDDSILFRYPFQPFAEVTLFVNYLGMFRRFCDLVHKDFQVRSSQAAWYDRQGRHYFQLLDQVQQRSMTMADQVYDLLDQSWECLRQHDDEKRLILDAALGVQTRQQVQQMIQDIMLLFPKCGMSAARTDTELNSVFRNFFTATQHTLLQQE